MGLVETRRERQMIYYSSNSQPARTLLVALDGIFREEPPPAP
jgi:DNA-binding transcriptional ArsR family regulator